LSIQGQQWIAQRAPTEKCTQVVDNHPCRSASHDTHPSTAIQFAKLVKDFDVRKMFRIRTEQDKTCECTAFNGHITSVIETTMAGFIQHREREEPRKREEEQY
jgi:hypothetical protein